MRHSHANVPVQGGTECRYEENGVEQVSEYSEIG